MRSIIFTFFIVVLISSCHKEDTEPTPPAEPTPTNPTDTTGTDTTTVGDTTTSIAYGLFEMFKTTSDGINLKTTVDSITFRNTATGYFKKWHPSEIVWINKNGNFYGSNYGNYVKSYIQRPTGGDEIIYTVYFHSPDNNRLIKMSYDDLPGAADINPPIAGATGLMFQHTSNY